MTGTHFDNGFGMGSNDHYTCANDMARLTFTAMQQPMFASAVRAQSFSCSQGAHGAGLTNTNSALASSGCIGVKSGSDSDASHCVIVASEEGRARLCAVILGAPSESAAYGYAERLLAAGLTRYIAGVGLRPFFPANALLCAESGVSLSKEPGGAAFENIPAGETLHAVGYSDGYVCVDRRGSLCWAEGSAFSLRCYEDDIFIENGAALSCVFDSEDRIPYSIAVSSRHEITRITLTLSLFDGSIAFKKEISPCAHGTTVLSGDDFTAELDSLTISNGLYICTVEAEAEASLPGFEPQTIVKRNTSMLAVGTGGACVSYNCNMGDNAPLGECFFGSFTVPGETPSRAGFVFSHWNTSPDNTGASYRPGDRVSSEGSLTLYAVWRPGTNLWETELRAEYDTSLMLEGFVKNTAGIASLRLAVEGGQRIDMKAGVLSNEAAPGELFLNEPITLPEGEYLLELYGAAAEGGEVLLFSYSFTVSGGQAATEAPEVTSLPEETSEPSQEGDPFSLAGLPIWFWFLLGTAVVIVLIVIIVRILKNG